jgi:hypothetical protein
MFQRKAESTWSVIRLRFALTPTPTCEGRLTSYSPYDELSRIRDLSLKKRISLLHISDIFQRSFHRPPTLRRKLPTTPPCVSSLIAEHPRVYTLPLQQNKHQQTFESNSTSSNLKAEISACILGPSDTEPHPAPRCQQDTDRDILESTTNTTPRLHEKPNNLRTSARDIERAIALVKKGHSAAGRAAHSGRES